jgi:hypothetical protein
VPNKWWEAKVLPLKVRTPCKCKGFECGGDWRNHFPVVMPVGYVQQWWDEQVPDTTVSFYVASESDHHVGVNAESLYINTIQYISTVGLTENDTVMLIRQVNNGGVITSDVVLSAVTTESAIEIKLIQQPDGVGTTLFQTANKKEDYKPEVSRPSRACSGSTCGCARTTPSVSGTSTPTRGRPTELMGDIAAAPAQLR